MTNQTTPGYNTRIAVYFTTTKSGTRRAYRVSNRSPRALPISVAEAEMLVATGGADLLRGSYTEAE